MRKIVDVIALERELENRLDVLNADTVFMQTDKAQSKINSLIERLHVVRYIKKNLVVMEWLMGSETVTRKRLLNQDEV